MAMDSTLRQWLPALKKEANLGNPDSIGILAIEKGCHGKLSCRQARI